ncbi:MAG: pyroglutamyl-peptidase I [Firmicutes bacterium]|nr:pyroglutamyl-peptidase I [Bacillota bacterium]
MKILLTGFEPFGGEPVNPALESVKLAKAPEGVELVKLEVPCLFEKCIQVVMDAVRREKPDAVLCVGQAGGRDKVTPERVAINVMDARIADNGGYKPSDVCIREDGPAAYFATLPVKAMTAAINEAGVPTALSNTAGTFCCNDVMYGVLHEITKEGLPVKAGFMHVPCIPEQLPRFKEGTPALPLEDIARAVEAALKAIAES